MAQLVRIHLQCWRRWFDSWVGKICWRWDRLPTPVFLGFPVAQLVKNPPAIWETWVQSLGWEDPLEKGKAAHSSILAWRIQDYTWGSKGSDITERLLLMRKLRDNEHNMFLFKDEETGFLEIETSWRSG